MAGLFLCAVLTWPGTDPADACTLYQHVWHPFVQAGAETLSEGSLFGVFDLAQDRLASAWAKGWEVAVQTTDAPWVATLATFLAGCPPDLGWKWAGAASLFAPTPWPGSAPGRLWVDILEPLESTVAMVDTNLGPAPMFRIGSLDRCTARLVGRTRDGQIPLVEEIHWTAQLEWDILTPAHLLVGGIWLRRVAWKRFPMTKRHEWMTAFPPDNKEELNAKPPDVEFFFLDPVFPGAIPPDGR